MSEISSSLSVMKGRDVVSGIDIYSVVRAMAADTLPANANDTPAAPAIGKILLRLFRFEVCFERTIAGLLFYL